MDPVVHFELPYDDGQRIAAFYEQVFGWRLQPMGEEMGNYVLAATSAEAQGGPESKPGAIDGGFYPRNKDWPAQYPSVVIAVSDIRAKMKTVNARGGEVLGEPMEIPGVGQYVSFFDTEKNRLSMLQPVPRG